jgi:hypothetical protein
MKAILLKSGRRLFKETLQKFLEGILFIISADTSGRPHRKHPKNGQSQTKLP